MSRIFIDCSGLEPWVSLRQLWRGSTKSTLSTTTPKNSSNEPSEKEFREAVKGYVDSFAGRVIKSNFENFPMVESRLYDYENVESMIYIYLSM